MVMNWYMKSLRQYVDFEGRARRTEYWCFVLVNILITTLITLMELFFLQGAGMFSGLYSLFILLPTWALEVRRLHDVGKSGWWLLLVFIPIINLIGVIWLLILCLTPGEEGTNQYGRDPKEIEE